MTGPDESERIEPPRRARTPRESARSRLSDPSGRLVVSSRIAKPIQLDGWISSPTGQRDAQLRGLADDPAAVRYAASRVIGSAAWRVGPEILPIEQNRLCDSARNQEGTAQSRGANVWRSRLAAW